MPQTASATKALRVSARKRAINNVWRHKVKHALLAVRDAINEKNAAAAKTTFAVAEKALDRAARRNIIHPNKAARKKSRLKQAISKLG